MLLKGTIKNSEGEVTFCRTGNFKTKKDCLEKMKIIAYLDHVTEFDELFIARCVHYTPLRGKTSNLTFIVEPL